MADELADDLAERMRMVAWEREEHIGAAQRRLQELQELRFGRLGGPPVCVRELREQPLEALEPAWRALRKGRRVHVESEPGACPGVFRILRERASLLGEGMLSVCPPGERSEAHAQWQEIGVAPRSERVALMQSDADPELAAYLLARGCLRRTGFDPRVVHRVIVVGALDRLLRNLRRLWVGARMGPVEDGRAFAGPVDETRAEAYLACEQRWRAEPGVTTICQGNRLQVAGAPEARFLAPALFRVPSYDADAELPSPGPAPIGPMLIVHPVGSGPGARERGEQLLAELGAQGRGHLRFGTKPRELRLRKIDSQVHGALLVERLPPGLPEPRP